MLAPRTGRRKLENAIDEGMQFVPGEIDWGTWVRNPLAAETRRSGELASTCELHRSLQAKLPTFFNRYGLITNCQRRVGGLETNPLDLVLLI